MVADVTPTASQLGQNVPNPFNPSTEIVYALAEEAPVRLVIYNLLGQSVVTLVDGVQMAGYHTVRWDASDVSAGVYLYRIQTDSFTATRRMIFVK